MSSGKKGKKTKGKTLALTDFLQETPGPVPSVPVRKSNLNWADEVDDYDSYESRSKVSNLVLPTAPKSARDYEDVNERIPKDPPFMAYISNLPYDVEEGEIADFFGNLRIAHMRIPKDERPGEIPKLKGFGYIEFEDRDSLIEALTIPDTTLKSRRMRIELSTNFDDKRRGGRMDMNRDRERSEAPTGDWRSGPRATNMEPERRGFRGDKDWEGADRDRSGSWRDATDRPSFRDRDDNRSFGRSNRDDRFGDRAIERSDRNIERSDRNIERSDRNIERSDRNIERSNRDDRFGDRNIERSNRDDRFGDRDGGSFRRFNDRDEKSSSFSRSAPRGDSESGRSDPRQRPKLVLAPRTKPIEPAPEAVPSSSIFGNAKPVDTSVRERQIEERLEKEHDKPRDIANGDSVRDSSRERSSRDKSFDRYRSDEREKSFERPSRDDRDKSYERYSRVARTRTPDHHSKERRGSSEDKYSRDSRDKSHERYQEDKGPSRYSRDKSGDKYSRERSPEKYSRDSSLERHDRGRSPERCSRDKSLERDARDKSKETPIERSKDRSDSADHRKNEKDRHNSNNHSSTKSPRHSVSDDRSPTTTTKEKSLKKNETDRKNSSRHDTNKHEKAPRREKHEKEMPRLKEPEPPNFAANNKFAYLQEDSE